MYQSKSDPHGEDPSSSVIAAVADEVGIDPSELPEPLYEAVDPDALDSLFAGTDSGPGSVTFLYCGCEVTVTSDDEVSVETTAAGP
jgi:hypothetical protein